MTTYPVEFGSVYPDSKNWRIGGMMISYDHVREILEHPERASLREIIIALHAASTALPAIAAEHAIDYKWEKSPMFGICKCNEWFDKWYKAKEALLNELERRMPSEATPSPDAHCDSCGTQFLAPFKMELNNVPTPEREGYWSWFFRNAAIDINTLLRKCGLL